MMRVLYTSTTGMRQHEVGLDVISNNLANANTTGFKRSQVLFSDLLYQGHRLATATTNPRQVGLGTGLASITPTFTKGSVQHTSNAMDMMIDGNGFFIINGPKATEDLLYTRAGHFGFDSDDADSSRLVDLRTGYLVRGWLADANGTVTPSDTTADLVFASGIATDAARATTQAALGGNLSADNAVKYTTLASPTMPVMRDWSGNPSAGVPGSYQITSAADGSYQLVFTSDTVLDPASVATAVSGAATVGAVGTYTVATAADGSAVVTFNDGVNAPVVTIFAAGTVTANSNVAGLIPGMTLTFGAAIAGNTTVIPDCTIAGAAGSLVTGVNNAAAIPGMVLTPGSDLVGVTTIDTTAATTLTSAVSNPVPVIAATGYWGHPDSGGAGTYRLETAADGSYRLSFVADDNEARLNVSSTISKIEGSATDGRVGTYTVTSAADGSASVSFDDGVNGPVVTNFAAGTITADSDVAGLVPGLTLTFTSNLAGTTRISVPGTVTIAPAGTLAAATTYRDIIPGVVLTTGASLAGISVISTTGASTAGEQLVTAGIYDAAGVPLQLETVFDRMGQNQWSYHMFVAGEELETALGTAGGETFTLDYAPEPGSVEIYVGENTLPLDSSKFAINGLQIVPVDTNGDLVNDSPAMAAGQSVRIRYRLAESGSANNRGTLEFDSDGVLVGISGAAPAAFAATFSGLSINTDFSSLVQRHGASDAVVISADGNAAGELVGVSVNREGELVAGYSNGKGRTLAQVAVANFINPQGLHQNGESYFVPTDNSGTAQVLPPGGTGVLAGAGHIIGSALEAANVDTATEIVDMIAFQRAYQLNSRGITTASDMIKTAVDMKR